MSYLIVFMVSTMMLVTQANADVFTFQNAEGFEKCMRTDHLLEETKTSNGSQKQFLSQTDIQSKCLNQALELSRKQPKNQSLLRELIAITKRETAHEQSLDLIALLVTTDPKKECNEMSNYSVLTQSLAHPKDYPTQRNSYFSKVHKIVKTCLKDAEFKKDFLEELDKDVAYVTENVCSILRDEKLTQECKKEKKQ